MIRQGPRENPTGSQDLLGGTGLANFQRQVQRHLADSILILKLSGSPLPYRGFGIAKSQLQ
jgi:hypothetical protein